MKVLVAFGTRPEGIKMAPLVKEFKNDGEIDCIFVNTAQHREMLDQVLELFSLTPDYDLNLMRAGQTPESVTSEIITRLSDILENEKPELVFVHGDTTTTFAVAYAAFLKQIPVAHVEAGLRTHNIYSPFPEEMNRQLVGRIASLHFSATEKNKHNLLVENVKEKNVHVVGNTVIDALLDVTSRPYTFKGELEPVISSGLKTVLMTVHRRENLKQQQQVYNAINRLMKEHDDIQIVFPVHKNPAVREQVKQSLEVNERVHLIEPLDYETFAHLMKESHLIITDSGGIQEEAPALGKPVLVARDTTERPEGVDAGTLKLVGTDSDRIFNAANLLLSNNNEYDKMSGTKNPYGNGTSSKQIVEITKHYLKTNR